MRTNILALVLFIPGLVTSSGCGTSTDSKSQLSSTAVSVDASQYKLAEEPDGAVGVIAARESAEDGAQLVLVGRIGGCAKPWVEGRAAFTLLDASMSVVTEGEGSAEGEICTGDCCATERLACTTLVKVVDQQGQIVPVDSRDLFGLKESDMVVVQGTAKKDESGNFFMLAKGIFIRN
jgi:hypothetical protein